MAVKNIVLWPDPMLKQVAKEVLDFGPDLQELAQSLIDTMDNEPMAGLAAPQIGISKRVFAVDIDPEDNDGDGTDGPEIFINPVIIEQEGSFTWEEGCMSIPGFKGTVKRAKRVIMRYQDLAGQTIEREALDYLSGCFQHELDHLNGILWVDYQSALKAGLVRRKMMKLKSMSESNAKNY